jgi:hypothetical protein
MGSALKMMPGQWLKVRFYSEGAGKNTLLAE